MQFQTTRSPDDVAKNYTNSFILRMARNLNETNWQPYMIVERLSRIQIK